MKRSLSLAIALLTAASCQNANSPLSPNDLNEAPALARTSDADQRHIVTFRDDVDPNDVDVLASSIVASQGGRLTHTYHTALKGFSAELSDEAIRFIRNHPDVASTEPDGLMSIGTVQSNAPWGLDRLDQRDLPLNTQYEYFDTGSGVSVYVIDTGIRTTHVEFGGRASGAFTSINDGNGTADCNGHGTHVSGTIGGTTYGVAKGVSLYAVRVLGCSGSGSTSGVIAGVDWVTSNASLPAVANMSLGGGVSTALDNAVRNSIAAGVTYVLAAGNSNADACSGSPSRVAEGLTVGATDVTDTRAGFSNFGSCLDLFGPGVGIVSAYGFSDTQLATLSGTSMAAPHVAGAAAIFLEENPDAPASTVSAAILSSASVDRVSDPVGSPNLLLFIGGEAPPPVDDPPTASFSFDCAALTCTFDSSGSFDDNGIVSRAWDFGSGQTAEDVVSPANTYASAGTYSVTLTVTDTQGQTGIQTQSVTVTAPPPVDDPPLAAFSVSCTGLTCTFDASASTDDFGITLWEWGAGPGLHYNGEVVTAVLPAPGTYTIYLRVTDSSGQRNSTNQTITVSDPPPVDDPPTASFSYSCVELTCTFDSSGSFDDNGIVSRSWDFGSGQMAGDIVSPANTYPSAGTYLVTLTVTDALDQTGTQTQSVTVTAPPPVDDPPTASFSFDCAALTCTFDSSGSFDDNGIVSRAWDFGSGQTAEDVVSPANTYASAGTYSVTLTVTDTQGQTGIQTQSVTVTAPPPVDDPPLAAFSVSCTGLTCTFDASASTDDFGITLWEWGAGPGLHYNGEVVTAVLPAPGTYTIYLRVTDSSGQRNSTNQTITIS